jgi:hypothetical protein
LRLNYKHFIIIGRLPDSEGDLDFWTIDRFSTLMEKRLKSLNLKQGGKILWYSFLRVEIKDTNHREVFFISTILFEKRVHLSSRSLFHIHYYDFETNKVYMFQNYLFLKEHKSKLLNFIETLKQNNSDNLIEFKEFKE